MEPSARISQLLVCDGLLARQNVSLRSLLIALALSELAQPMDLRRPRKPHCSGLDFAPSSRYSLSFWSPGPACRLG